MVAGTPSGDFEVTKMPQINRRVVTGNYPAVMVFVSEKETSGNKNDFEIGLIGRSKHELDAEELGVVHTEDKQNSVGM